MSILYIHDLSLSFLYDEKVSQSASSHFFLIFFFYIKLYRTALHNSVHGSLSGRCCYLFMGSQSGRSNYLNTFEISGDHIICTASCDPVSYVEALVTVETRYLYKARYLGNKLDICTRLATQATMFSFMVLQYLVDHVTCSWSSSIWQIMLPVHGPLVSGRSCYLFMAPCLETMAHCLRDHAICSWSPVQVIILNVQSFLFGRSKQKWKLTNASWLSQ